MDRFAFVPWAGGELAPGAAVWFVFRGRTLLVGADYALPDASPEALGLAPVRTQRLGHLAGRAVYAAELAADVAPPEGTQFRDLRQLFGRLAEPMMALAGRAVQIADWDRTHQYCGACATPTEASDKRHARRCPRCALEVFPRLAPAMIVAVERGDEILLARSPHFPPGIYSVLAGFVDPGESVEDAVHREVFEEVGLTVRNVRYFGSQPWPFPNSLMLGFQAEYAGGELVLEPGEIEDAGFFHVDRLPSTFPGRVSISQWLLHDFIARRGAEARGAP
ncbi:MAG: NAD(+) diphosphatase [Polyangiales bacterium]